MEKRAAMEMSVGTIVTIVLLMSVLVLGVILINKIYGGAIEATAMTEQAVKNEIQKLFSEQSTKKVLVVPDTKKIAIKKGESSLGFGFSIRNTGSSEEKFSYEISATEINNECKDNMRLTDAENLIALGREGSNILLPPGSVMDDAIFIRFDISESTPPCQVRYQIQVYYQGTQAYSTPVYVDLEILSE